MHRPRPRCGPAWWRAAGIDHLKPGVGIALLLIAQAGAAAEAPRNWPRGFPAPVIPVDNPLTRERIALGERLFSDTRLSVTGRYSCASCHDPARAYTDGRALAMGALGDALKRNAPSILYSAWNPSLGWDVTGSATLEEQMRTPLLASHPVEMGLAGIEPRVMAVLEADATLRAQFAAAFPGETQPIKLENVIRAIAGFERSLGEASSDFDRYVFGDEHAAMSAAALRGMGIFFGQRAGCAKCHAGMAFAGPPRFVSDGPREGTPTRVPSLRNVAVTAPYMRDGALPTLEAVIDHYDHGNSLADPPLPALHLSAQERADLQAFLESLTDRPWQGLLSRP